MFSDPNYTVREIAYDDLPSSLRAMAEFVIELRIRTIYFGSLYPVLRSLT